MSQQKTIQAYPAPERKYRIVQWGAGNIGTHAMRAIIQHPDMTLVGLKVKEAGENVGKDAGELCGLGPIGVIATGSIEEIIALKPDCVAYMQQGCNFDDVCKLLASGANIVTTCLKFHHPAYLDPAVRERVEEACRRGGSSIHCSGSSPGFKTEYVPLVLTSTMRRLDLLSIDEFSDLSRYPHPVMLFEVMGFGLSLDKFSPKFKNLVLESFRPSLSVVADAISMPLDSFEVNEEVAAASHTTHIAAGVLEAGTIAARRVTVTGMRGGRPLMRFCANWYCTTDIEPSWSLPSAGWHGWHLLAEGDPPLDVTVRYAIPEEQYEEIAPGYTAYPPVNAIPYVCAAPAGICTTVDLPWIIAKL